MFAKSSLAVTVVLICSVACARKVNTTAAIIALPARLVIHTDFARTPGVANPNITQANIKDNVCSKRWSTKSIRPPASFTAALKVKQMAALGLQGTTADYEEDHFVSWADIPPTSAICGRSPTATQATS